MTDRLRTSQKVLLKSPVSICKDKYELEDILNQWMRLFDQAFFFRSVRKRWPTVTLVHGGNYAYGWYDHDVQGICINLDPLPGSRYKGSIETRHICTLLHEMLHAFLRCYTCMRGNDGCKLKWEPSMGGEGSSGYGPA
jgi:hypothetical protein